MTCTHMTTAADPTPQITEGCQECVEQGFTNWVHLRLCLECGHVGCCDSSPHKHATLHYGATHHPVIRSFQPGETWRWCYVDEVVA